MNSNCKNNQYIYFENIELSEVMMFFDKDIYIILVEQCSIHNLCDLFTKEANGTLKSVFCKDDEMNEKYISLSAIIKILKCKYLKEDPIVYENTSVHDFGKTIGILSSVCKRLEEYGINNLKQLYEMAKENDFSKLMNIEFLGQAKVSSISAKIKILYNYYFEQNNNVDEDKKDDINLEIDDKINNLKTELITLREKSQQLNDKIKRFQLMFISIYDVKDFFSPNIFEFLIDYRVYTLADLFKLDFSVLRYDFLPLNIVDQIRFNATVNILKCKYLNVDPLIDENTLISEFKNKLGISYATTNYLVEELNIKTLKNLFDLYEKDKFKLNFYGGNDLILKIEVLYNYKKGFNNLRSQLNDDLDSGKQYTI